MVQYQVDTPPTWNSLSASVVRPYWVQNVKLNCELLSVSPCPQLGELGPVS